MVVYCVSVRANARLCPPLVSNLQVGIIGMHAHVVPYHTTPGNELMTCGNNTWIAILFSESFATIEFLQLPLLLLPKPLAA